MSDNEGCGLLVSFAIVCAVVAMVSCVAGTDTGREQARCAVHAEYAKTAADTAALVRRLPECAERYYPQEAR